MIDQMPTWVEVLFFLTTILTILFFYFSNGKSIKVTLLIIVWSISHSVLASQGFYLNDEALPPRFVLVLIPPIILIIYSLFSSKRQQIFENRNTKISTFLHVVRFPVEIVLFELFVYKMVPESMTFEGWNFDIIMGITAPIIGFLYLKNKLSEKGLILWNVLGLVLVSFILLLGILSAELPFQQFGLEQPNRGINYFPFILLPATIVPIVWWTHLTDILILRKKLAA